MIKTLQKGARYTSRVVRHFVEQAALKGFDRLPQHSASRSYWHDPTRHALVGLHLGIDLHRYDSRYHVLETNLGAMLRPERRELYDAPLDPNIFLSAHARLGRIELPNRIAGGLVEGDNPFLTSFSAGSASYSRVEPIVEDELRLVAEEFGRMASLAINRKFRTAPGSYLA